MAGKDRRPGTAPGASQQEWGSVKLAVSLGQVAPVYMLFGEDAFGQEQAWHWLVAQLLPAEAAELNHAVLDGAEITVPDLEQAVLAFPFGAQRRVVTVRRAEELGAEVVKALPALIENLPPTSCLILLGKIPGVGAGRAALAQIHKVGQVLEFQRLRETDAVRWVQDQAREEGLRLAADAAEALVADVGPDLQTLSLEWGKIVNYLGDRRDVRTEDIAALVGRRVLNSVFDLTEAASRGDLLGALSSLEDLWSSGENETRLLAMLAWHYRNLLYVHSLWQQGVRSPGAIAQRSGQNPFTIRKCLDQAPHLKEEKLVQALNLLLATGARLRSGLATDKKVELQALVYRLAS